MGPRDKCTSFLASLKDRFECTEEFDLEAACKTSPLMFLGHELWIEWRDGQRVLRVSQERYTEQMLGRLGYQGCNGLKSLNPDDFSLQQLGGGNLLSKEDQSRLRSIIGAVSYLSQGTRPDLMTPTLLLAEGQSAGRDAHLEGAKKLLRHIAYTRHYTLSLPLPEFKSKCPVVELGNSFDANFTDDKARSGGVITLDGTPGFWYSRKQRCIVLSTAESELVSASVAAKELLGAQNLLSDIWGPVRRPLQVQEIGPRSGGLDTTGTISESGGVVIDFRLVLRGDSQAANCISASQAGVRRVRHLTLSDLFVRQATRDAGVEVVYLPSGCNISDILTKVLSYNKSYPLLPGLCLGVFD